MARPRALLLALCAALLFGAGYSCLSGFYLCCSSTHAWSSSSPMMLVPPAQDVYHHDRLIDSELSAPHVESSEPRAFDIAEVPAARAALGRAPFMGGPSGVRMVIQSLRLVHCYGPDPDQSAIAMLHQGPALVHSLRWKRDRPMALYIFGVSTSPTDFFTLNVRQAYLRRGEYNLVVLDWNEDDLAPNEDTILLVREVARAVALALDAMLRSGARLSHLVGHGLGAHLAGHVARRMRFRVPRVVGLDPTGPFSDERHQRYPDPLQAEDANCVAVVHTNDDLLGSQDTIGDADFFPNNGTFPQPGCGFVGIVDWDQPGFSCSHIRAIQLWATAVRNPGILLARRCASWDDFEQGLCNNNPVLLLGHCGEKRGNYYLRTAGFPPYEMGLAGALVFQGKM